MDGHVITKFSGMVRFTYPWCFAGALRAPELRYKGVMKVSGNERKHEISLLTIDHSRICHKHARENMKVRLGWTNIKHGGQHLHFFARWP